jgi:hypothetical protein
MRAFPLSIQLFSSVVGGPNGADRPEFQTSTGLTLFNGSTFVYSISVTDSVKQ